MEVTHFCRISFGFREELGRFRPWLQRPSPMARISTFWIWVPFFSLFVSFRLIFFKLKLMKIRRISYVGFLGLGDWWLLGKQRKQGMNPLILPQKISLCALLFKNMVVGLLEFLGNCWFFLILMIKDFTNSFSALKVISLLLICFLFVFVMCMLLLYFPCPETRAHFLLLIMHNKVWTQSDIYLIMLLIIFWKICVQVSPWQTLVCVKRSEEFDTFSFWMEGVLVVYFLANVVPDMHNKI